MNRIPNTDDYRRTIKQLEARLLLYRSAVILGTTAGLLLWLGV